MLGNEIKNLRKSLNLNQSEFASIFGVVQQTVSSWEANNSEPPVSFLIMMYEKWKITPNTLIFGTNFDKYIDMIRSHYEDQNNNQEIESFLNEYLKDLRLKKLNSLIRAIKGENFIKKLSESWSGKGERILIILYHFIEYIENQNLTQLNKSILINLVNNFDLSKKVKLKHLLTLNKNDQINFKEWIESNFDDLEANLLITDLPKTKEFIKSELNYLNRYWI